MDFEKYLIPVEESYLFNQVPIYSNFDKWLQNENRVLWITGISGGGKGYYAKKIANENDKNGPITIVELDKFENYLWYYMYRDDEPHVAKGDKIIYNWLSSHYDDMSIDVWVDRPQKYQQDMREFIMDLMKIVESSPDERFIVEGIQIFCDDVFRDVVNKDSSVLVIQSTKLKSMARVMHREHNQIRNRLHHGNDPQGKLSAFIKHLDLCKDEVLRDK